MRHIVRRSHCRDRRAGLAKSDAGRLVKRLRPGMV
jgi:hypothetical protein